MWRLQSGELQRLTHSHTGVLLHAGSAADGQLASVVIAPEGSTVARLAQPAVLQRLAAVSETPAAPPARSRTRRHGSSSRAALLGAAARSTPAPGCRPSPPTTASPPTAPAPRAATRWAWHRYAALAQVETSQKELIGSLEYQFAGSHGLAVQRELVARTWRSNDDEDEVTAFDRNTRLQWLSLFPFSRLERRVLLGVGAAADWSDRVDLLATPP